MKPIGLDANYVTLGLNQTTKMMSGYVKLLNLLWTTGKKITTTPLIPMLPDTWLKRTIVVLHLLMTMLSIANHQVCAGQSVLRG